ncbi:hypothetical protein H072_9120 [Dactylellina haptotyla CBS 200.50]|uniref:Nitrogen regulatory protein areA GATA-like domain-containing protein n=1 Tax=Dactylellina haptotyla (strain CBS 200.50) TaxID=1284197 RepID=S8A7W9_DACHA|nr:hypothetical protein H072_9120 [Dactylellina haptotyla CBS 200.50]
MVKIYSPYSFRLPRFNEKPPFYIISEAQYASMLYYNIYKPPRTNAAPNFNHISTSHPKPISCNSGVMPTLFSLLTNLAYNLITYMTTYISTFLPETSFEATSQSFLTQYKTEITFAFPVNDLYIAVSGKPRLHHLEHIAKAEKENGLSAAVYKPTFVADTIDLPAKVVDDILLLAEPSQNVDYLSHDWKQEDIWASRKYKARKGDVFDNTARLENASWRAWMKVKQKLTTVFPEQLNWMKDHDSTWLYGPFLTMSEGRSYFTTPASNSAAPRNHFHHRNTKKSILKRRTTSEVLLQWPASGSNRSQQTAPSWDRTSEMTLSIKSDIQFSSSPKKHIRFNGIVDQYMALETEED